MHHYPLSRQPAVYIMASGRYGVLYIGVTMNLPERVWQHKNGLAPDGFTARYRVYDLVWYELFEHMPAAIAREKALKKWRREWKIRLVEEQNPEWLDLFDSLIR
ncbi:GIY-YIG nuclease superfamily protein [Kingella potus]|uniref:GIY-YIG nuclease superfamily protein n=1 Tax=Kingella potus TaxID=265175 RepID=A0A377R2U1_9NEIS|nr:GIY-YIG nuclease family protein [Kingella potus]UOP00367.1 GIY-YIG nuclease family protein [Kingella potus]STR02569.1 GIY-YIG nuclease superfamily protein [Kingella potus]